MADRISTQGKIILVEMHLKISPIYLLSIVLEQYFNFFRIQRSNFFQIVNAVPVMQKKMRSVSFNFDKTDTGTEKFFSYSCCW